MRQKMLVPEPFTGECLKGKAGRIIIIYCESLFTNYTAMLLLIKNLLILYDNHYFTIYIQTKVLIFVFFIIARFQRFRFPAFFRCLSVQITFRKFSNFLICADRMYLFCCPCLRISRLILSTVWLFLTLFPLRLSL